MKFYEERPELFGLKEFSFSSQDIPLQEDCARDWKKLQQLAKERGIELAIVSGLRTFNKQLSIWNAKAKGERPLLNDQGFPLEYENLSQEEIAKAILRWSALPGLSRHHWATDCDVIDQKALENWRLKEPAYQVQLVPSEYETGGIFEELGLFLEETLEETNFFRPYQEDLGGVAPEPWHLSHEKSLDFMKAYTYEAFNEFLESPYTRELELLEWVKENASWVFENYFLNITRRQRP